MANKMWDSDDNSVLGIFSIMGITVLGLIFGFAGLCYGILASGFVGMKLWAWFIVPVFGVKALTITQAWGIALLASIWTHQLYFATNKDERENSEKISQFIIILINPWVVLLFAWIGKTLFM